MKLRVFCSPDADDLFMMWALTEGRVDPRGDSYDVALAPTDELNRIAARGEAEVCAISFGSWPDLADRWLLLPHGGSMGEGYGPVVIANKPVSIADLPALRLAVPGLNTTAWMVLRMISGTVTPVVIPIVPYARIFDALRANEVDAGLVIHEGRLTWEEQGFHKVVDLGEWWAAQTGLPLPLGANAIRADLPTGDVLRISSVLRESIRYGLDHREEAIRWLLARGGALRAYEDVDRYLSMYANERTFDYGPEGRRGIEALFERAAAAGILPAVPRIAFSS
jgi:1,4-dihydroxy-6-naphthoate synthase